MNVTSELITQKRYTIVVSETEAKLLRMADTMLHELEGQDAQWRAVNQVMHELDSSLYDAGCPYEAWDECPF